MPNSPAQPALQALTARGLDLPDPAVQSLCTRNGLLGSALRLAKLRQRSAALGADSLTGPDRTFLIIPTDMKPVDNQRPTEAHVERVNLHTLSSTVTSYTSMRSNSRTWAGTRSAAAVDGDGTTSAWRM
ncbi:hypothetical protein GCM10010306_051340 [Streptomyces umbrinus]|nr:hypothetical protein GCM10010306_051340 [Streptomyces umbrinus]